MLGLDPVFIDPEAGSVRTPDEVPVSSAPEELMPPLAVGEELLAPPRGPLPVAEEGSLAAAYLPPPMSGSELERDLRRRTNLAGAEW